MIQKLLLLILSQISSEETIPTEATTLNNSLLIKTNISRHEVVDSFTETLKDVAYYLRAHKFNEFDRRYEKSEESADKNYYKYFVKPPLRSLHWEVRQFCEPNFTSCVDYLGKKLKLTALKRTDDTSFVIQEQRWDRINDAEQIKQVDSECEKMRRIDNKMADPFAGPLERFQWRTTASYYMCWYTMLETPELEHFGDHCDNFAACLDSGFGPNNWDVRANDTKPFACSLYSFCPDPCCPFKHLNRFEDCWDEPENPCFRLNTQGHRNCFLNFSFNIEMNDLVLNRFNVTCACPQKGYIWSSLYGFCIDSDECENNEMHNCDHKSEACLNSIGSYKCVCKWGYIWSSRHKKCVNSAALELIKIDRGAEKQNKTVGFFQKVLKFFGKSGCVTFNPLFRKHLFVFTLLIYGIIL